MGYMLLSYRVLKRTLNIDVVFCFTQYCEVFKMRKPILSLEEFEPEVDPQPEPNEFANDGAPSQAEAAVLDGENEASADQLDEAAGIDTALERSEGILEAGVETGEGVSPETAEAVDVALEHFQARLKISPKRRIRLSQEAFGGEKEARLAATVASLEQIKTLRTRLASKVEASLEDHFDGQSAALHKRLTVHEKRLVPGLKKAADFSWTEGNDHGKKISGAHLGQLGENATGAAVVKSLKAFEAAYKKAGLGALLHEAAQDIEKLAQAIESNKPDASIEVGSIETKAKKAAEAIDAIQNAHESGDSEVAYPKENEGKEILTVLNSLLGEEEAILKGWEALIKAGERAQEAAKKNPNAKGDQFRWAGRLIGVCLGSLPGFFIGWVVDHVRNKNRDADATLQKTGKGAPNNAAQQASRGVAILQTAIEAGLGYLNKTAD